MSPLLNHSSWLRSSNFICFVSDNLGFGIFPSSSEPLQTANGNCYKVVITSFSPHSKSNLFSNYLSSELFFIYSSP